MKDIASKLQRALDDDEVLATAVEEIGRTMGVDRCFVRMVEAPGIWTLGPIEHEWDAPGVPAQAADRSVLMPVGERAAATRQTCSSEDLHADAALIEKARADGSVLPDARGVLATPLLWGDELLGVIVLHSLEPRRWTDGDSALIEEAAYEVSAAAHHARRYHDALHAVEELQQLEQRRADYIAMVSHEIRSPITVVAGIADVLRKKRHRLSEEALDELIGTLEREASRLARLVSEVLDLERMDRGGMELVPTPLDLVELINEAVADTGESSRVDVRTDVDFVLLEADRDKIKQVLINLIGNAAKFAPDGSTITVTLSRKGPFLQVGVADLGPGIAPEERDRLFRRFSRLGGDNRPGSGLGLYLSRLIVERHGGEIWVESELGKGAAFYFTLPETRPANT